jgi:uncharacterized protein (DUF697 family)
MSRLQLGSLWAIIREVNFNEIHAEAERPIEIVVAGPPGSPANELAAILKSDEVATQKRPASVIRTAGPPLDRRAMASAGLLISIDMDPQAVASVQSSIPVIRVRTGADFARDAAPALQQVDLPALDRETVEELLAPPIIRELASDALAAARRLPILRRAYAGWLINETSRANAVYALSMGIAEAVPVLDIPLNMADIVILTKNQSLMVYKLALAAGKPMSPRRVMGELLSVIGAGFLWRQIARQLIGLIPVVGIIPKIAVAYAGTYAVGQIAETYLIGGQVPAGDQLKVLYAEALERGRALAQALARREDKEINQLTDEPQSHSNA